MNHADTKEEQILSSASRSEQDERHDYEHASDEARIQASLTINPADSYQSWSDKVRAEHHKEIVASARHSRHSRHLWLALSSAD